MTGACSQQIARGQTSLRSEMCAHARCHLSMSSDIASYIPTITTTGNHISIGIACLLMHEAGASRFRRIENA
jgi:hypothetical protein